MKSTIFSHTLKLKSAGILLAFLLPVCISSAVHEDEDWKSLFNGRNFDGWQVSPGDSAWTIVDGVIDCDPKYQAPEKNLWTEKEYRDFILRVDWRIKDDPPLGQTSIFRPDGTFHRNSKGEEIRATLPNGDSGIFLRGETKSQVNIWCNPGGSGDITGYRVLSPYELLAGFMPRLMADNYTGDWNTFEISMTGDMLTVVLNGHTVIDNVQLYNVPDKGRIGLQHHGSYRNGEYSGGVSLVQFRNIYIKELTPVSSLTSEIPTSEKAATPGVSKKKSSVTGKSTVNGKGVKDIDGNKYRSVIINNREWMAENLKTTRYSDGTSIPEVAGDYEWSGLTTPGFCWYNNDKAYKNTYGALYNWFAVSEKATKGKSICPVGWRVPTDEEWTGMTAYISGINNTNVGNQLKSCRQSGSTSGGSCSVNDHPRWDSHSTHYGADEFGFSALPGGARHVTGIFYDLGGTGNWWSSTEYYSTASWAQRIYNEGGNVNHSFATKRLGFSVRCIKE